MSLVGLNSDKVLNRFDSTIMIIIGMIKRENLRRRGLLKPI